MSTLQMQQEDHPAHNVPDATQQYAGDVLTPNFPQSGLGGAANQVRNQGSMRDIAEKGAKAVDPSNLTVFKPLRPGQ